MREGVAGVGDASGLDEAYRREAILRFRGLLAAHDRWSKLCMLVADEVVMQVALEA